MQYCQCDPLDCQNYLDKMEKYQSHDRSTQVILNCLPSGENITCSRLLLSEKSVFFRHLFASPLELGKEEFVLKDIEPSALRRVIMFFASSDLELDGENVMEYMWMSVYLLIPSLRQICFQYLKSTAEYQDYFTILFFAKKYHVDELLSEMTARLLQNADIMFADSMFLECDHQQVGKFIGSDELRISSEERCWHAVRNWYLHYPDVRESAFRLLVKLPDALNVIRDEITQNEYFSEVVGPLLKIADEVQADERRAFEMTHPEYHMRNHAIQEGLIILNDPQHTIVAALPEPGAAVLNLRAPDQHHIVGLFNPSTRRTQWLHKIPERFCPESVCCSPDGFMFCSSSWRGESSRILRYCSSTDSWDALFYDSHFRTKGMCVVEDTFYVFHTPFNPGHNYWFAPTFLKCCLTSVRDTGDATLEPSQPLPFEYRWGYSQCVSTNGCIYVFGCQAKNSSVLEVGFQTFCYEAKSKIWTRKSDYPVDMIIVRDSQVCAHPNGLIYFLARKVFGGNQGSQFGKRVVLRSYDPVNDTWSIHSYLKRTLLAVALWLWNDKIIIKIENNSTAQKSFRISVYDPEKKSFVSRFRVARRVAGILPGGPPFRLRKSVLKNEVDEVEVINAGRPAPTA